MRAFFLSGLLVLAACGNEAPAPAPDAQAPRAGAPKAGAIDRSRAGTAAPDTRFENPDGEAATLADFRGKPVLLNLWATWCAPCVKELPTLDALQLRQGEALKVLTVSQDMEGRETVEAFLGKGKYRTLEPWLDPQMALMSDVGVTTLPTTILYDAQGREVWRVAGDKDWAGAEAAALIAEASRAAAR
jgi:thiol-disulfide isomerase/thioredoxin